MTHSDKELWLHPFLIALFPVMTLMAGNLGEMNLSISFRPAVISLLVALVLFLILRLVTRDWRLSAVLTSFYLVMFFSYGHVYNLVKNQTILGIDYGRHRILGIVWVVLIFVGSWLIFKKVHLTKTTTALMNVIGVLLIIYPAYQISAFALAQNRSADISRPSAFQSPLSSPVQGQLPDIYYIILDRYAREDIIRSQLGYDSSGFIRSLEQRGFYIARCSRSNYPETFPSMASSLNMTYLDELTGNKNWQVNEVALQLYIRENEARLRLESLGYQSVSLSAYQNLQWPDAAIFLDPSTASGSSLLSGVITPFEAILLRTTVLRILLDLKTKSANQFARDINYPYAEHVQQQIFILNKIPELPFIIAPTFAYIHITIPHPPYVFGPHGELVDVQTAEEGFTRDQTAGAQPGGYVGQVEYIDRRMLEIIDGLIANSNQTPMIILQGDHGIAGIDPDAILNAYLVPEPVRENLYSNISPVNTFRVILSSFFGEDFPLLPDQSYIPGDVGQMYELSTPSNDLCASEAKPPGN